MVEIDEVIGQVESLYRSVTGKQAPNADANYAPIPPERDPVMHVQEQMDRLMRAISDPSVVPQVIEAGRAWVPPISVWETANEFTIDVDLPGITRDRLEVTVHGSVLVIAGVRTPQKTDGLRLTLTERPFGPFRRTVLLPNGLRTGEMSAQLKDGVLEVRIPREDRNGPTTRAVPVS
jgi:HSP20 family protein